ncbi:MAG: zinc ribbon domain-containing protein [Hyphomicrobiales bacterium]
MRSNKHCQSCGIKMDKDPEGGGTLTDLSRSDEYCSFCLHKGNFTDPDISIEEMREKVKNRLIGYGIPSLYTAFITRRLEKLKRWKKEKACLE